MAHRQPKHVITTTLIAGLALAGCALEDEGQTSLEQSASPTEEESGGDCTSEVTEYGLLCSTCPGQSEPECLVADCSVIDRCLQCRDPRGRVGADCSVDYEVLPIQSHTFGGGGTFNVCSVTWGAPGGAGGACHYPGPDTCSRTEEEGVRCTECVYPGGAGSGSCLADPDDEETDPLDGRPADLPAAGECVTGTSQGGLVECSTCTRADLEATTSCRFAPAEICDIVDGPGDAICLGCTLAGGGTALMCDPPAS